MYEKLDEQPSGEIHAIAGAHIWHNCIFGTEILFICIIDQHKHMHVWTNIAMSKNYAKIKITQYKLTNELILKSWIFSASKFLPLDTYNYYKDSILPDMICIDDKN